GHPSRAASSPGATCWWRAPPSSGWSSASIPRDHPIGAATAWSLTGGSSGRGGRRACTTGSPTGAPRTRTRRMAAGFGSGSHPEGRASRQGAVPPGRQAARGRLGSVELRAGRLGVLGHLDVDDFVRRARIERRAAVLAELRHVHLDPDGLLLDTDLPYRLPR